MADSEHFSTLIVITPKDCRRVLPLYPRLIKSINYGEICFVGTSEVGEIVKADSLIGDKVKAINEDDIIPFDEVHRCMSRKMENLLAGRQLPRGVTGWYYQQFLKMQYALTCQDKYYMVWDGDTIPCRELVMFQEESGKPYLDLKHEYHKEYFDTMAKILPGFGKMIERSFISEHMLFCTDIMRQLIKDIENNESIQGTRFWEKIINAIDDDKIQDSSFSEFETYGTYVALKYPTVYMLRDWHSFRQGGTFFSIDTISDRDFEWLAKDFGAISFEKGHEVREDNKNLFDNPYYQEKLTPKQMLQAAQLEYQEGYKEVWTDDKTVCSNANSTEGAFDSDDVVPEDRLKYLDNDTYLEYEKLGDKLVGKNDNQAFLCFENAEFLCRDEKNKEIIRFKKDKLQTEGKVKVNKAAIVVLSYNNAFYIQRCIESIYTNCNPDSCLLMIFDNGSSDGTREWLSRWGEEHDEAIVILNEDNLGFSGGNNACCQYLPEGYDVFYLNNDTRIPPNALFWMRMGLYSSEDVGGVGAVQNYAITDQLEDVKFDIPEQYVEYGAKNNVYMDNPYEEQSVLCGFAMMISRKMYEETGGFDEQFNPGFLEDDDLSLNIRRLGKKLLVCHNAFVYHAGSQSFGKRDDVNELFKKHREKIKEKWGFDSRIFAAMSENELSFARSLSEKGFDGNSEFSLVHLGCGCGNMLGHIHYLFPKAELAGVEELEGVREYAIGCIAIYGSSDDLPMPIEKYDIVAKNLG